MRSKTMVLCVLAAACLVAGCGKEESTTFTTPEGKVTVTAKQSGAEGTVKVETREGTATVRTGPQTIGQAELGVPAYPGAQVISSGQFGEAKGSGAGSASAALLSTNDPFDKVVAFYKANMKDIRQTMDQTAGDQKMVMFTAGREGNMRNVQIVAAGGGGPTNIHIMKVTGK